jgi:hypothetical protein
MGSGAMRWVGLRHNVFRDNYVHPQVGNYDGGVIGFDPCADQIEIADNEFTAPTAAQYGVAGIEVYSRNVTINSNNGVDPRGETTG